MSKHPLEHISDIAIRSCVNISRNIKDKPFPNRASDDISVKIRNEVYEAIKPVKEEMGLVFFDLDSLGENERNSLIEKHIISKDLGIYSGSSCFYNKDETMSTMINESDHLNIQGITKGFNVRASFEIAKEVEQYLSKYFKYAYSDKYGYLTCYPTNVGSGVSATVVLHLPALSMLSAMNKVTMIASKFSLNVTGMSGDNVLGDLYQITSQNSLSLLDTEIISNIHNVTKDVIIMERSSRNELMDKNEILLRDTVCRAYGVLTNAYTITIDEAMKSLSEIKLGIDLGIIDNVDAEVVDQLMTDVQPYILNYLANRHMDVSECSLYRAAYIKEKLLRQVK